MEGFWCGGWNDGHISWSLSSHLFEGTNELEESAAFPSAAQPQIITKNGKSERGTTWSFVTLPEKLGFKGTMQHNLELLL